ncbi:MAG TPA: DUF2242 domain-containing protein [Gallionella sp.]|nr:DUF2242 domain-containing protein [Gallionella sp.]
MKRYAFALMLIVPLLAACSGPRTIAARETFEAESRHYRDYAANPGVACQAARRVLLSDGYVITPDSTEQKLSGDKEFQVDKEHQGVLRVYVTCSQRNSGSTVFVTATEHHFAIRTSRETTSVGVPLLPPLALYRKNEIDNLVQTWGETVSRQDFYEHFYEALDHQLTLPPKH